MTKILSFPKIISAIHMFAREDLRSLQLRFIGVEQLRLRLFHLPQKCNIQYPFLQARTKERCKRVVTKHNGVPIRKIKYKPRKNLN